MLANKKKKNTQPPKIWYRFCPILIIDSRIFVKYYVIKVIWIQNRSLLLDNLVPFAKSKDAWKCLGLSNEVSTGLSLLTLAATLSYRKIKRSPLQLPINYCLLSNCPIKKHNNKTKSRFHAAEILDKSWMVWLHLTWTKNVCP